MAMDENASRAEQGIDGFLESYYGQPASVLRQRQACYGGPAAGAAEFFNGFAEAGASHIVVRLVGGPESQLETVAGIREQLV